MANPALATLGDWGSSSCRYFWVRAPRKINGHKRQAKCVGLFGTSLILTGQKSEDHKSWRGADKPPIQAVILLRLHTMIITIITR